MCDELALLMYSMDSIMANLEKMDMGPVVKLFDDKVVEEQIKRREGQVDMLIGLTQLLSSQSWRTPRRTS